MNDSTQVYKIDFSCRNPETAFVHIREIQGMRGLHLLSGSRLVTKSVNGDVTVFDVNSPEICTTLQNPSHPEVRKFFWIESYAILSAVDDSPRLAKLFFCGILSSS